MLDARKDMNKDQKNAGRLGGGSSGGRPKAGTTGGNPPGGGTPAGTRGGVTNPKTNIKEKNPPKKDPTKSLPPGLNPAKYSPNPTPEYEASMSNLGTLVSENTPIVGQAKKALGAMGLLGDYDPMNPYSGPKSTAPGASYDKSEVLNASKAFADSGVAAKAGTNQVGSKKKKPSLLGNNIGTLLAGAGGTLTLG